MKLPSRLIKSRHGVFYYRFQFQDQSKRKEYRFSLHTKNPAIAKAKSIQISAIIIKNRFKVNDMANNFDPDDSSTWSSVLGNKDKLRKLDFELPNGMVFRDIKNSDDINNMVAIMEALNISSVEDMAKFIAGPNPRRIPVPETPIPAQAAPEGGMTIQEMISRYATNKAEHLGEKTLYEYGNYQRKFAEWIATSKNNKNYPMRLITKKDIAFYINDLMGRETIDKRTNKPIRAVSDRTIKHKYLAALGTLFELAQTYEAYPEGPIPTIGHKIFTKKDLATKEVTNSYQPFSDEELSRIFNPEKFSTQERPADFWLPLLAIFTGGRIAELCQLAITDITNQNGTWAISINDEDYKRVKSNAARRIVPIHPQLMELGFLDYVDDAQVHGDMLFPYLTPDKFLNFSGTPSERFGKYLDTVGITNSKKVFHSFRSTANGLLKDADVAEESRCQFVGHEHGTINSTIYAKKHTLNFLLKNVATHLIYTTIEFDKLVYTKGRFSAELNRLCKIKTTQDNRKKVLEKKAHQTKILK
ncbi:MAG: site-specific integrase [Burkholderiales bacterium]